MVSTQVTGETSPWPEADSAGRPFYRMFLVHHTHWDREWWATYQDFRIRLVELIDDLLDALDTAPGFRGFLLDGQTIVLRDYLEIRPENQERLANAIRSGRIQCGPWYILPDEFLVSGEAHLRNLWLGRHVATQLGVPLLTVGYIPDTFGHIAQMPQILQGFGIDNAFVWRGRSGVANGKQEFLWEAPDGSEVLTHWFPNGYYQMPFLHFGDPGRPYEDKLGRIYQSIQDFGARATTNALLLPYGGDHRPIDRNLAAKIDEANREIAGLGEVRWSTLEEYVEAIKERNPSLETIRGELRAFGLDHPHVLPGVLSTRLYLKRLNAQGQTWLERYAEPLSALAWLAGGCYDAGFLWRAWELLVQNHPHDSICGCSIDQVHREMLPRFDQSRQIAEIVSAKAAQQLNLRIDTMDLGPDDRAFVVHNALPVARDGWASVWVERADLSPRTHRLLDETGAEVAFQVRQVEGTRPRTDQYLHTEIGFVALQVPGLGYRTFRLTPREPALDPKQVFFTSLQPVAKLKGSLAVTDLAVGRGVLENRFLRVAVERDGTLTVTDKRSGQTYHGLNAFEDGGDAGDEYNFSAPLGDLVLRSDQGARVHVSVADAGYARATLRVDLDWPLPDALAPDRLSRSSHYLDTRISSYVSLTAGSTRVEITVEWENRSRDHRLRALFPLGAPAQVSHARGQFEVAERPAEMEHLGNGWQEPPVPTLPNQGWVGVDDARRGLLVANRGLPEFELLSDGEGTVALTTVALTILRAVGWCSRVDLLSRVGGAGPTTPTPDAQCLGTNRVSYAIIPHAHDWLTSGAYLEAEEYLAPLYGSETGRHPGDRGWVGGLVDLAGDHTLVLSACKKAEQEDALILRFWNVARTGTEARVCLGRRPQSVRRVDLKEDPVEEIECDGDGSFRLPARGAEIVTVAVKFQD